MALVTVTLRTAEDTLVPNLWIDVMSANLTELVGRAGPSSIDGEVFISLPPGSYNLALHATPFYSAAAFTPVAVVDDSAHEFDYIVIPFTSPETGLGEVEDRLELLELRLSKLSSKTLGLVTESDALNMRRHIESIRDEVVQISNGVLNDLRLLIGSITSIRDQIAIPHWEDPVQSTSDLPPGTKIQMRVVLDEEALYLRIGGVWKRLYEVV